MKREGSSRRSSSRSTVSLKPRRGSVTRKSSSSAAIDQSKLYAPLDVLYNILLQLPVRSLLRFKSVSKPWFRTISDPKFVNDHVLLQSALNPNELFDRERILLFPSKNYFPNEFSALDLEFTTYNACSSTTDHDSYNFKVGARVLHNLPLHEQKILCGSCNGLLLFRVVRLWCLKFFIWNPSTDACTSLFSYPCHYHVDGYMSIIGGLCYDSSLDDYKVVFAIRRYIDPFIRLAVVYSLKSNSWKEIGEVAKNYTYFRGNSVIVNGALHWLVRIGDETYYYPRAIIYFDLLDEKFKELPLSECLQKRLDSCYTTFDQLALQKGRLCLISGGRDHTNIDVWIMNEYGVGESWAKLFSVPQDNCEILGVCRPYHFCFTKKDRLLCVGGDGKAALYSQKQNKWEVTSAVNEDLGLFDVTTYVPSLVSPICRPG